MGMAIERVLITGGAGYIGSVMTRHFLDQGRAVHVLDSLMFGDRGIQELRGRAGFGFHQGDVRDEASYRHLLREVDAVVHLAGMSGMPSCAKFPDMSEEINWTATRNLFDACNRTPNVQRFVFASSTSVYGAVEHASVVDEQSRIGPISLYGEQKVKCESHILGAVLRESFVPTVLRFPTAYGISPRMRFDLTVNEFTRDLTLGKNLDIFGEYFWRPYAHVIDLSRACLLMLDAPRDLVRRELFGAGDSNENYTKRMIYEILLDLIPNARISLTKKAADARDYRVGFSKIKALNFTATKTVRDGVREVYDMLKGGLITNPYDREFTSAL